MVKSLLFLIKMVLVSKGVPLHDRSNNKEQSFSYIGSYKEQGTLTRASNKNGYYVFSNGANWANAMEDCKQQFGPSADLVSIESLGEWEFLKEHLLDYSGTRYWTSGMYDPSSYVWRWKANNQLFPYFSPWASNIPTPTSVHRVLISYSNLFDASWGIEVSSRMERYICEVPTPEHYHDDSYHSHGENEVYNSVELLGYECKPIFGQKNPAARPF